MWHTIIKRRELLEMSQFVQRTFSMEGSISQAIYNFPAAPKTLLAFWDEDPARVNRATLPSLVIMRSAEINEFFAAVNSSSSTPTPFSAFSRVLSLEDAMSFNHFDSVDHYKKTPIIEAVLSLSFIESIYHASGKLIVSDLSPAICKRTFSYTWARALTNNTNVDYLDFLPDLWLEALSLSGNNERIDMMQSTISDCLPILHLAAQLYLDIDSKNDVMLLCKALVEEDHSALEKAWKNMVRDVPGQPSIRQIAESTREERGSYFQSLLNVATRVESEDLRAACAFLATQISPRTFDHLQLLLPFQDRRLALWYTFMAALQRARGELGFSGGLGSRVARDIARREELKDRPTSDISLPELRIVAKFGVENLVRKLSHSNEIEVEIAPCVPASFRFSHSNNKQSGLFQDSTATKPMSEYERLLGVIDSLTEISKSMQSASYSDESKSPKRARKKYIE